MPLDRESRLKARAALPKAFRAIIQFFEDATRQRALHQDSPDSVDRHAVAKAALMDLLVDLYGPQSHVPKAEHYLGDDDATGVPCT